MFHLQLFPAKHIVISCLALMLGAQMNAQLVINEVCASNNTTIEDQYGDTPDWIELYNTSESAIALDGYFLSDNMDNLAKWAFPNMTLNAESSLIVFASSRDETGVFLHSNFKLSASGEPVILSTTDGTISDQINFSALETDQSIGRITDGHFNWVIFNTPTPNQSNALSQGTGFTQRPEWTTSDHFFESSITMVINHPNPIAHIFFTRDGSIPTIEDEAYTTPIVLDTTTAIRVIAFVDGQLPSPIISKTFFIGVKHSIPVFSIMGDPAAFWSWENGILVNGGPNAEVEWPYLGSNYWADIEVPVHLEYFTDQQKLGIKWQADIQTHGGRGARTNAMKPMRILNKKKYGARTVDYPFFYNRERTNFKRLVLRNASGDYNNCHFRDAFLFRYFIDEGLNIYGMAHQPVIVYINGVFYGVENLREKSDQYYLKYNLGLDLEIMDFLEEDTIVLSGDFTVFDSMYQYVATHDLSNQDFFEQAATYFDHDNIGENFIIQSAINNADWLHNNIKFFRERSEGSRWRYLLFDLDNAMGRYGWSDYPVNNFGDLINNYDGNNRHVNIFTAFLANENYRFSFINRYADLMNTVFRPEILAREVDRTIEELEPEMPQHFGRWNWPGFDVWRNNRVLKLYEYLENRPDYAREDLREYFSLTNEVTLKLNTYPEGAGTIQINTILPDELPWDGVYFNGVPVTLTIIPAAGYTFAHWQSTSTIISQDENTSISYNFEQDDEIVAYFIDENNGFQLNAFINVAQQLEIVFGLNKAQEIQVQIYDLQGRLLQNYPAQLIGGGAQRMQFGLPNLSKGMYIVRLMSSEIDESAKFLILG